MRLTLMDGERAELRPIALKPRRAPLASGDNERLDETALIGRFSVVSRSFLGRFSVEVDMSEQGWRDFLAAHGGSDWVVLHGGATAVFRVTSVVEAARLAEALAHVPEFDGAGVLMTIADGQLTVRLTRSVFQLEERHVRLADAISAVARKHGAVADRTRVQEAQLAIAALPDAIDVGFWRAVLGYAPLADDSAVDPLGHGPKVWMQALDPAKPLRHAMHIDVSVAREQAESRLAAALAAGGRIVDDSNAPAVWILADRAGNRVCIASWPDGATSETQ